MLHISVEELQKRTISIQEYLDTLQQPYKAKFLERKHSYRLADELMSTLKEYAQDVVIIVFSADWCKDCAANVPVLALLSEKTGIPVTVFGGLKTNPLNPREMWKIPPSPPEVKMFNVRRIPCIIVFTKQGKKLGTIIEHPKQGNTLEREILDIIQQAETP